VIDPSIEAQINKLFADFRCEIAAQREADTKQVIVAVSDVAVQVFAKHSDKLGDRLSNELLERAEKLVRDVRDELFARVDKRFAELQARLSRFLPDSEPPETRRLDS
jgi:hypothetical protein